MKRWQAERYRKPLSLLCCFIIPVIILLVVYHKIQMYPFGPKSLLMLELRQQYVAFFSYYKEILAGQHSLFYSFSKGLGGDMFSLFAYYLSSPLNLLLAIFPEEALLEAVWLITVLKIGLCGLAFGVYAQRVFRLEPTITVVFSIAYALIGYNIAYQSNLMWIDSVMLLPLVVLGIEQIREQGKGTLFVLAIDRKSTRLNSSH